MSTKISHDGLRTLAAIRKELRVFLRFSEEAAHSQGLATQQHQALLAIAGTAERELTVGDLGEALLVRPHSASGLVSRLESLGLVERFDVIEDGRQRMIRLTAAGDTKLAALSDAHRAEFLRLRPMLVRLLEAL